MLMHFNLMHLSASKLVLPSVSEQASMFKNTRLRYILENNISYRNVFMHRADLLVL